MGYVDCPVFLAKKRHLIANPVYYRGRLEDTALRIIKVTSNVHRKTALSKTLMIRSGHFFLLNSVCTLQCVDNFSCNAKDVGIAII